MQQRVGGVRCRTQVKSGRSTEATEAQRAPAHLQFVEKHEHAALVLHDEGIRHDHMLLLGTIEHPAGQVHEQLRNKHEGPLCSGVVR